MKKYQKKPVIVDAIQLTKKNIFEVYTEVFSTPQLTCKMAEQRWDEYEYIVIDQGMALKTPESGEGTQIASIGDYIVFGYSDELGRHCWPVKPDYFTGAYEEVLDDKES